MLGDLEKSPKSFWKNDYQILSNYIILKISLLKNILQAIK